MVVVPRLMIHSSQSALRSVVIEPNSVVFRKLSYHYHTHIADLRPKRQNRLKVWRRNINKSDSANRGTISPRSDKFETTAFRRGRPNKNKKNKMNCDNGISSWPCFSAPPPIGWLFQWLMPVNLSSAVCWHR